MGLVTQNKESKSEVEDKSKKNRRRGPRGVIQRELVIIEHAEDIVVEAVDSVSKAKVKRSVKVYECIYYYNYS